MADPRPPRASHVPREPAAPGGRRGRNRGVAMAERAAAKPDGKGDRIAKLLARAGAGSRRDIERMIAEGRVALNGVPLTTPATVLQNLAGVTVDGHPVAEAESTRLFLFHKPAGFLTAARDPAGRPTIYDALPPGLPRLMPVGRLDLNTEGLLLLTNDGELKRALELPASGVPRTYRVRAYGEVKQRDLEALATGVTLAGVRYGPVTADVDRSGAGRNFWLTMTLAEGKNREVRKLCEAMGLQVSRLIRVGYGPFALADLPPRAVGEATPDHVRELRRMLKVAGPAPKDAGAKPARPAAPRRETVAAERPRRTPRALKDDGGELTTRPPRGGAKVLRPSRPRPPRKG
ncbi:pseudouridine synthase [Sandaracinobacteroides saxicola]|uniref:Pseudouridine synthase n=1 Tax=Sandaracinobacteroides saxicola TaxID=2759707 RepID=A0A7G5IHE6_9SPHN|nr:pseudouridine synthase [Sandaracinobacteroides saxicola]QMW22788.1 rRNA pseudouridine synthase [Sandaracinobacteroides saxicola]